MSDPAPTRDVLERLAIELEEAEQRLHKACIILTSLRRTDGNCADDLRPLLFEAMNRVSEALIKTHTGVHDL